MSSTTTRKAMAPVVVKVEYCGGWGYGSRFERLKQDIEVAVPGAQVSGTVGRKSSFEVTLNGKVVFSKLKAGKFPENEEIVEMVKKEAAAGK